MSDAKKLTEETLTEFLKTLLGGKAIYIDTKKPTYLIYDPAPLKAEAGKESNNE